MNPLIFSKVRSDNNKPIYGPAEETNSKIWMLPIEEQEPDNNWNINDLEHSKLDWDVVGQRKSFNSKVTQSSHYSYDVYRVNGFNHTIGGKWGKSDLYACRRGQELNKANMVLFSGHMCCWGFLFEEYNLFDIKHGYNRLRKRYRCIVTRNNQRFYSIESCDASYVISSAQVSITKFKEHPIPFNTIGYERKIYEAKLWFDNVPCVISNYSPEDQSITLIAVNGTIFTEPAYWNDAREGTLFEEGTESISYSTDVLDPGIFWYRDTKQPDEIPNESNLTRRNYVLGN